MNIVLTKVLPAVQRGDLAIALAQLAAMRERFPEADISLMCRCPMEDVHWFSQADRVSSELFPMVCEPFFRRLSRLMRIVLGLGGDAILDDFRETLIDADVLVFCGGGSPGGYGFGNLLLNAWCPAVLAKRAGVPIVFSGLGIISLRGAIHAWLQFRVLRKAEVITVRDPLSFEVLEKLNLRARSGQTADWAWLLPTSDKKTARALLAEAGSSETGRLRLGVNLRSKRSIGPEEKSIAAGNITGEIVFEGLSTLIGQLDAEVFVFSMNRPPASDDLNYARELMTGLGADRKKRIHLLEGEYTPSEIKAMIAMMDLFIGTRLHPSLFAISMGVPTVTVHDQGKVRAFMQQVGLDAWQLPARNLNSEKLVQKVLDLHAQGEDISALLQRQIPEMEKAARSNLEWIFAVLSERRRERSL